MKKHWDRKEAVSSRSEYWMIGERRPTRLVPTFHGLVFIYLGPDLPFVHLDFVWRGYHYKRWWHERISRNYCVTLAKRFADEIVAAAEGGEA